MNILGVAKELTAKREKRIAVPRSNEALRARKRVQGSRPSAQAPLHLFCQFTIMKAFLEQISFCA